MRERADRRDGRRRLLSLSPQGRRVHGRLLPIWHAIRDSTDELLADARTDLLRGLDRVEAGHARASVLDRVRTHLDLHPRRSLRLVDYRPAYKKHFRALNEAWLTRHFRIEPPDRRLLEDPNGRIVRQGGQILFALWGEEVVGTCALVRHRDGTLELTKLAVAAHASSQGVGRALAEAIIERARATDAEALYLLTSPKLEAAIKLYRQLGFRPVKQTPLPEIPYRRTTFAMHKQLRGSRPHDGRGPSGPRGRLLLGP